MRKYVSFVVAVVTACSDNSMVVDPRKDVVQNDTVDATMDVPTDRVIALDVRGDMMVVADIVDARADDVTDVVDASIMPPDADVRCLAGMDTDGDGLNNDVECRDGTDPLSADSDMDGLTDGVEARYPRVCVATDRARQRRPPVACTSSAGCMTGEMCQGLNPRSRDTDGDGVSDGTEDPSGDAGIMVSRGESDPRLWDTDGDGVSDGMSGLTICRPDGLATVTQTALTGSPMQVGYDPIWGVGRRVTGTASRSALVLNDTRASVAALVVSVPSMGDVRVEATRIETAVTTALGAGVSPVLVGRALVTHEMNPAVTSTYRVARATNAPALRDALLMPLVGAAPTMTMAYGVSNEFLVDVTTVRRIAGRGMNTNDVVITVAPRTAYEDAAMQTSARVIDLSNTTALAESDKGLGFYCQRITAPAAPLVDFVWTVDVSISMGPYQQSIGETAQQFFRDLNAAGIDFRVAVLQAQSTPFNFAMPALQWVSGAATMGATELAYRVTVERFGMMAADRLAPYGNAGAFVVQMHEEPLAAGVLAFEALNAAPMTAPIERRIRPGARVVNFFVADETGVNDDMRYFAMNAARWGATYEARLASAIAFFRSRNVLTFGMVNDQRTACSTNAVGDFRKCLITGNGGAYIPITGSTPADVSAAMRRITDAVAGAASPYRLERQPITSTIKVKLRGMDVPRSRADGFDYDQAANTIVFRGTTWRPRMGDEVVISYRLWQPCPSLGATCSASGECCAPQECVMGRCAPPCRRIGLMCTTDAECCAPNACVMGRCAPRAACLPVTGACTTDGECCAPNVCTSGRCSPPMVCVPPAMRCVPNELRDPCCPPAICVEGTCGACRRYGEACTRASDCCGGFPCEGGRCSCRPTSGACTSAADCCSGSCADGLCAPG
jgi:hypothetical protein